MADPLFILFDLDGTLVDTAPDLTRTLNVMLTRRGRGTVLESDVRHMVGHGARAMLVEGFARTGDPVAESGLDALVDEFVDHYGQNIAEHSAPFPGVPAALARMEALGAAMAVCTNKLEGLSRNLLSEVDLIGHFPVILGRDSVPIPKPDPGHLLAAVKQLGGEKHQAIMVGDSPTDIDAAKAAGIPSIAVSFGYTPVPPEKLGAQVLIHHFDELEAAVDRIRQP